MAPSTVCVFPGTNVDIYCALPVSTVTWSNAKFGVNSTSVYEKKAILGPDINLCFIDIKSNAQEICANSSAIIQNFPKSLDGLDITCRANNLAKTLQVFVITVIGKM